MAYQKLQAGKAWSVNTSDNTDIPDTGTAGPTGTTTSGSATQLIDSNATFLTSGVHLNMIIVNTTDNTQAVVIGIEDDNTLTVSANIFAASGKAYEIYGGNQEGAVLYIGTAGNLKVTTVAGDEVTFQGINTGAFFPVQVKKVWATGTSASNIIALW
ncbi:MAG: hypothetical protein GY810_22015 [Aureispira sp.]|jgi:hypothetical protein|nr:hypothetical protein [Alteromonadales bacterium]MCP4441593.1 hypothetical protein [Aureispira sp.]|tara:strand:- start:563 stop:1033 length:471 start_codon:yes stop_codon:yes gene_type:complete